MNSKNLKILTNIIGGAESGGQVYGRRNYAAYAAPYTNSDKEHTITLGWAQNYGDEAYKLISLIYAADPVAFDKIDPTGKITAMINGEHDWVAERWNPSTYQRYILIALIDSPVGHEVQDKLFVDLMTKYADDCKKTYTTSVPAVMMYCEIRHLGGKGPVDRIFKRCDGIYTLDAIMNALKADQDDTSSSNQVGDRKFWSRHECCAKWIKQYVHIEDEEKVMTLADARKQAKKLLYQTGLSEMSGYTPEGKQCFVDAGRWTQTDPQKGDIIYFYSSSKGRVGHVGVVERVDPKTKTVYTIEGNTSSTDYNENGGCVARHQYSYAKTGGKNRVNGFGHPNFMGTGISAERFVDVAKSWIGYLEKKSKSSNLDSKTADKGYNNFTRFQRDACGYVEEAQWCQYFVSCMAVYCFTGTYGDAVANTLNESQRWIGECTADELNVRNWAGTENANIKSWPIIKKGNRIGVCDTLKAKDGSDWYYIVISNAALEKPVHGFASAKYIRKVG